MKRTAITLAEIAAYDNLLLAVWKAARGKRDRPAVARFLGNLDHELERLAAAILAQRVPIGRTRTFTIHDPKRRTIHAASFADRVLHHAIMNLAEPRFERMLVENTFACRPGKGVHAAVTAVQTQMRKWRWYAQVDVDGYFPSIDHARLKALLARRFKGAEFLALLGRIIDSTPTTGPGRGLPIGALTSQHFANAYLDGADRWLLGHTEVRAQVRYMDDIVWWCDSREAANRVLDQLRAYLDEHWHLRLKGNVRIAACERGIAFCGFRVRLGIVLPSARKLMRYRAAARRLQRAAFDESFSSAQLQRAHDGALAALAHTESCVFRRRLWHGLVE